MLIEPHNSTFSLRKQCELLGLNRSSLYYQPVGERAENLNLMRLLDEQYTRTPYYGVLRMVAYLRSLGHLVNVKRVRRLLRIMGLDAVYQKPNTSQPNVENPIYPYRLRGLSIERCDQVWSTDITYVRLASGFVYLMAVMDWYSRYVLGWAISTTLDADFCIEAVDRIRHRALPSHSWTKVSRSVWMDEDGPWTTFLWNDFGEQSSMNTSTYRKSRAFMKSG